MVYASCMIDSKILRWLYAILWTLILLVLLLQSSGQPVVGPPAPPGDPSPSRELLFTFGHFLGFTILPFLWWRVFSLYSDHAMLYAVGVALIMSFSTEYLQSFVPDRSASIFDLTVNALAIVFAAMILAPMFQRQF